MISPEDQDAVLTCADLIGRTGAKNFEIGYLHDDVPVEQAGWYAHAQFRGARIIAEDQPGPAEAAEALARQVLSGGQCRCGRLAVLSTRGGVVFPGAVMTDGTQWTAEEARAAGQCLWQRHGRRWDPSCPVPPARSTSA